MSIRIWKLLQGTAPNASFFECIAHIVVAGVSVTFTLSFSTGHGITDFLFVDAVFSMSLDGN